jgi:hypothetical protein
MKCVCGLTAAYIRDARWCSCSLSLCLRASAAVHHCVAQTPTHSARPSQSQLAHSAAARLCSSRKAGRAGGVGAKERGGERRRAAAPARLALASPGRAGGDALPLARLYRGIRIRQDPHRYLQELFVPVITMRVSYKAPHTHMLINLSARPGDCHWAKTAAPRLRCHGTRCGKGPLQTSAG